VELINKYRMVAQIPAVDKAIENIVSDAVIVEEDKAPVSLPSTFKTIRFRKTSRR
jgi:hypothetical protein